MSNDSKNRGVFSGTSTNGNLQEALDQAIAQAGQGVPWRLASIEGVQGIVNSVTVQIFAVAQKEGGTDGGGGGGGEFEVPTSRTGTVIDIEPISICNDGARWALVSQTPEGEQHLRLATGNPEVERVLNDAAGTKQEVTVSGYIRHVECERMDVYDAQPAAAPATTL